ncbi:serine/threonine protein kinase [Lentzea waywayandensis]|uniref:Serine/threonine protein kinase n=1 Tax=Lentzea waywayandensis TaxID=84724 RepID=A0A1I6FJN0_9PSEU|nr:serine/threonine-protein kinase [Lentzea waywayandensis]SFR30149.1 serine/threonine protein kinase [Lentzea waywayandensis]
MQVKLRDHEWSIGDRIGKGGYGQVFEATSANGDQAAAKLVPKEPGAEREALFGDDVSGVRHVVPMIDQGETEDHWVLVMPRAQKSLKDHLDEHGGPFDTAEAVAILTDIAETLADLDGRVVHRDLKPENVLLLEGRWCLADFGIARYADAATATVTYKDKGSKPYTAPERWRGETATNAADVYSLGVIAYELLAGKRPFTGSDGEVRRQHLEETPAHLEAVPALLAALVEECLTKAAAARPRPANVVTRLAKIEQQVPAGGLARLQEANRVEAVRRGEAARDASRARTEAESRQELFAAAKARLDRVSAMFKEAVLDSAPTARQVRLIGDGRALDQTLSEAEARSIGDGWALNLGTAVLSISGATATSANPWGNWPAPFSVIAHGEVTIRIPPNRFEYEGRQHSLWYCDAQETGHFQWFETAFMVMSLIPRRGRLNPFAIDPSQAAASAIGPGMAEWQLAWPFTPLSVGDMDEFVTRWGGWFGDGASGQLRHPSHMPDRSPDGSWRKN